MQLANSLKRKAYTLVEMLVALAVGVIVVMATYASYEMVNAQYQKNTDIANMHTSGRAIMQMIERDVRMAGFEYRHTSGANKGKKAFGSKITKPLDITDSGNKCCDEVKVIYDYFNEDTKTVKRIQVHYFTKEHNTPKKGNRYRLYKQVNEILPNAKTGSVDVLADFVEDLQLLNTSGSIYLYTSDYHRIHVYDSITGKFIRTVNIGYNPHVYGNMDIDTDGLIYVVFHKNWKWTVGIIDPERGQVGTIEPPGRYNRFNPALGFGPDGFLYVDVTSKILADVYDVKTKKLIKSIKPNQQIIDLLNNRVDVNKDGMRCEIKYASINCSNPVKHFSNGKSYSSVKFGHGGVLYASTKYRRDSIDVFDVNSEKLINQIKVGQAGQDSRSRTYGMISKSNIKTSALVEINLILRTKNQYGKDRQFKKKDYHSGNFKLDKTDKYKRDEFSTTVLVRNLAL